MSAMTSHPQKFTAGSVWCVCGVDARHCSGFYLEEMRLWKHKEPSPTKQISKSIAAQKLAHICATLSLYFFIHASTKKGSF